MFERMVAVNLDAVWKRNIKAHDDELTTRLEHWMSEYQHRLLSLSYSILHDQPAAQDCVQEAFIKAGLKARQLRDDKQVFIWLSRIVVNQCKDYLRRRKVRQRVVTEPTQNSKYEDVYPSLQESELYRSVCQLPDNLRIPIVLHYYDDLKISEVAEIIGVSEAACRVRLSRARDRLRKTMEGEGHDIHNR